MQILVLYHSVTGRTRKLAEAVAEGVRAAGAGCVMRSAAEVTREDFRRAQGIIAGSPVYYGSMAAELKAVFDRFVDLREEMEGKIGAAFATAGDPSGGKETTLLSILQAMLINGMIVAGDPLEASGHYGVACAGEPDRAALAGATALGRRIAALAARLRP